MARIDISGSVHPPTRDLRNLLRAAFTPDDLYDFCEKHPLFQPCLGRFGAERRLEDMIQQVLVFTDHKLYWEDLLDGIAEHAPQEYNRTASRLGWPLVEEPPAPTPDRLHPGPHIEGEMHRPGDSIHDVVDDHNAGGLVERICCTQAVDPLIEALNDDSPDVRRNAALALGRAGDLRAVDALMAALQDDDSYVRNYAAGALGQLGDERAVDALVEVLADAGCVKTAAWALEQIGGACAEKALLAPAVPSTSRLDFFLEKVPVNLAYLKSDREFKADLELFKAELEPFQNNIEATIQPYIAVRARAEDRVILWHSKFGGRPYLPQGTPYPTTPAGRPLFLLAQINFAQVPRLEPFPREGILQFYIADDDLYGMPFDDALRINYDNLTTQAGFRVLYFPQVIEDEKELVTDLSFLPNPSKLSISRPHSLTFERRYAPISAGDYRFESALFGRDISHPERTLWEIQRVYFEGFGVGGEDKIGGYPEFVTKHDRYDPRKKNARKEEEYEILLLQTSDTWFGGEWGTWRFFIREKDLRERDFSRVMYYCDWDID